MAPGAVADSGRTAAYLLVRDPAPFRARELVRLLRRHRIEMHGLDRGVEADNPNFRGFVFLNALFFSGLL
jgi:hypothetical protein